MISADWEDGRRREAVHASNHVGFQEGTEILNEQSNMVRITVNRLGESASAMS